MLFERLAFGSRVAVRVVGSYVTVAASEGLLPCLILTLKVNVVIVVAFIASLKTTFMFAAGDTSVAPLVGTVLVTVGGIVSTVHVWLAGVPSVLPAPSVPRTWKVCEPLVRTV